ncbi:MAG: FkbM family methyltransferase [Alphaproteobacteria bacterium]|nr:FkbM family methyltransferase [Alphaproteobacteria bacterium]
MARILLLTDDPDTRDRAESMLGEQGHEVTCAYAPGEAARSIETALPDLMLADCTGLGEHVAMQVARAAQARGIRVILITANMAWIRVMRRANLPVLEKPPPLPQLRELVDRVLANPSAGSAVELSLIDRSLAFARNAQRAITHRLLRLGGDVFDRFVQEYRCQGLRFEIPLALSTPEFRARFLLHRYEVPERVLSRKHIPSDATVLELGGCLGVISCLVNRRLADPRRHVVFEAHPLIVPYLEANRDRNGCGFMVRQEVISRAPAAIFYRRDPSIAGGSTVRIGRLKIEVPTTTVERVERETGLRFDSLVIDIEGGEHRFFAENESLTERLRVAIIEFHPQVIGNVACADIRDRLAAAGLSLQDRRGHVEAWLRLA